MVSTLVYRNKYLLTIRIVDVPVQQQSAQQAQAIQEYQARLEERNNEISRLTQDKQQLEGALHSLQQEYGKLKETFDTMEAAGISPDIIPALASAFLAVGQMTESAVLDVPAGS